MFVSPSPYSRYFHNQVSGSRTIQTGCIWWPSLDCPWQFLDCPHQVWVSRTIETGCVWWPSLDCPQSSVRTIVSGCLTISRLSTIKYEGAEPLRLDAFLLRDRTIGSPPFPCMIDWGIRVVNCHQISSGNKPLPCLIGRLVHVMCFSLGKGIFPKIGTY